LFGDIFDYNGIKKQMSLKEILQEIGSGYNPIASVIGRVGMNIRIPDEVGTAEAYEGNISAVSYMNIKRLPSAYEFYKPITNGINWGIRKQVESIGSMSAEEQAKLAEEMGLKGSKREVEWREANGREHYADEEIKTDYGF